MRLMIIFTAHTRSVQKLSLTIDSGGLTRPNTVTRDLPPRRRQGENVTESELSDEYAYSN